MEPKHLNYKAKRTYIHNFLSRVADFMDSDGDVTFRSRSKTLCDVWRGVGAKKVNIKIDKNSERCLREMIRKNSRYGSIEGLVNEAVQNLYLHEKNRKFK